MKELDGQIQFVEDWYSFYLSTKENSKEPNWLVDFALESCERTLSNLYSKKNRKHLIETDLDDIEFGSIHLTYNGLYNQDNSISI